MGIEENKALMREWFHALLKPDPEKARALIDDDCRFYTLGDMSYCGWQSKADFLAQTQILKLASPITMRLGEMTAEGDRVFVEAESRATLAGGGTYNNHYVFMARFRDGKMIEHKEFADTLHIHRVVDAPEVTAPPIARQGPLTSISEELRGGYFGEAMRQEAGADAAQQPSREVIP